MESRTTRSQGKQLESQLETNVEDKDIEDEEKEYAQLPRSSIQLYAESVCSSKLSENALALLAENVNYLLRQTLQNAGQFMRHCGRSKLNTHDINRALTCSDVPPIYGHSTSETVKYICVKDADIQYIKESEIDIVSYSSKLDVVKSLPLPSLKVGWIAIEGIPKATLEASTKPLLSQPSSSQVIKIAGQCWPEKRPADEKVNAVPDDLLNYFNLISQALIGYDVRLVERALSDLGVNSKISPLLPYLTNFVVEGVTILSRDLNQLSKVLFMLESLLVNPCLYLGHEPYLSLLVQSTLYCVTEPFNTLVNSMVDHWLLRDRAAHLLTRILHEWATPVNLLYEHTLIALEGIFTDLKKPFCSHYGAVVAIVAFGVDAIKEALVPHMERYMAHLNTALQPQYYSHTNLGEREDAQMVYGALFLASNLVIRNCISTDFNEEALRNDTDISVVDSEDDVYSSQSALTATDAQKTVHPLEKTVSEEETVQSPKCSFDFYNEFYSYFGGSFAAILPPIRVQRHEISRQRTPTVSLFQAEPVNVEEFWDDINRNVSDTDVEMRTLGYDEECDDEESEEESDTESYCREDSVDLQVKETISHPTRGIKLKIVKIKPSESPQQHQPKPAKRRKVEYVPPFERVPLIKRNTFIAFNFDGGMPIPWARLKQRKLTDFTYWTILIKSKLCELSKQFKITGKKKVLNRKLSFQRKLLSGDPMFLL